MENTPAQDLVASKSSSLTGADKKANLHLVSEFDELDHQLRRHRDELQAIDAQIAKLEEAIDSDQARLKALKEAIASKAHARSRLIAVRGAMSKFIQGLQLRDAS